MDDVDDVDGGGGDGWQRIKKKRRALELLLESSDSSESEEELGPRGGKLVRAGGWGRKPRMGDLVSLCLEDRWKWPSWQSNWLNILKNEETYNPKSYWGMNFRGKFRVPRKVFDYLLKETAASGFFTVKKEYGDGKRGPAGHPLELKLLSSLRVMAKGCDFEAVSEVALISPSTLEIFHWQWLKWAVEHLFPKWVKWPSDAEALSFMGERPLHTPPMLLPFHVSRASLSLQISGLGWASQALSAPSMVCTAPGRGARWG